MFHFSIGKSSFCLKLATTVLILHLTIISEVVGQHRRRTLPLHRPGQKVVGRRGASWHDDIFFNLDRSSVFSDILPFRQRPVTFDNKPFSKVFGLEPQDYDSRSNPNPGQTSKVRPRHLPPQDDEVSDFGIDENELTEAEPLDVKHPESPYGLIQEVLTNNVNVKPVSSNGENELGGLSPNEVWLSDGDLLILKGGTTNFVSSGTFDNPWPPIDNYEAPYREPVFAPDPVYDVRPTVSNGRHKNNLNENRSQPNHLSNFNSFDPAASHIHKEKHQQSLSAKEFDHPDSSPREFPKQTYPQLSDVLPPVKTQSFKNDHLPPKSSNFFSPVANPSPRHIQFSTYELNRPYSLDSNSPAKSSTTTRIVSSDFKPSLQLNPSKPVGGFLPVAPQFVNEAPQLIGAHNSGVISDSSSGFESLISQSRSPKVRNPTRPTAEPATISFFDLPESDDRLKRQKPEEKEHQSDQIFDSLSSQNFSENQNFDFEESQKPNAGRTVIHGIYPRVVRQRTPYTVPHGLERVSRTRHLPRSPPLAPNKNASRFTRHS